MALISACVLAALLASGACGQVSRAQDKTDAAARSLREHIAREPDKVEHRIALIDLLVDAKRTEQALEVCEAAIELFDDNYALCLATAKVCQLKAERIARARGKASAVSERMTDSTVFAEDAKRLRPGAREPRALLGLAFLQLGRLEEAEDEIDELVKRYPNHPGGFILRGNLLYMKVQGAKRTGLEGEELFKIAGEAKVAFQTAIRLDPRRVSPHRRLGDLAAWQRQTDTALDHYAAALARDPARGAPLAWVYQNLAADKRLAYFQSIVAESKKLGTPDGPKWAQLFWYGGLAAFDTQKWSVARALHTQALKLEPSFTNTHFYIGLAFYNEGKHNEATLELFKLAKVSAKQLAEALAASGNSGGSRAAAISFLARRAHKAGVLPVSRDLNHALAMYSKSAFDWNNYAFLCRETQLYEESYAGYQKALAISPKDPGLLNDCAVILHYHLRRDLDKARAMYESAISEGKRVLATKGADPTFVAAARKAIQDASGNLAVLGK